MNRTDQRNKVRVGAMVGFAYRSVFGRLGLMLDLGWVMLLALMAALILPGVLDPDHFGNGQMRIGPLDYAQAAVGLLSLSAFAVRWHQSILAGDPHRLPARMFFRGWLRFLIYGCVVYLLLAALAVAALTGLSHAPETAVASGLVEVAAIVAALTLALGLIRFSLVFPAAACDAPLSPAAAWRMMHGNTWRFAFASILAALPVTVTAVVVTAVVIALALPGGAPPHTAPPLGLTILAGLIETAANFLLVALGASLLSGFYRELMRQSALAASDQRV
jgi:hypothetical protein